MRVKTDFELRHFVEYMNVKPNIIEITDKKGEFYVSTVNQRELFNIHENVLQLIKLKCPYVPVLMKILN